MKIEDKQKEFMDYYVKEAERLLLIMKATSCEEARERLFKTAVNYLYMAMQQIEHLMNGHSRLDLWAGMAAAGCIPGWSSRFNVLLSLTWGAP